MEIVKAALFDIDGILLDTEIFQYQAWADIFEQLAGHSLSKDEYAQKYCGNSSQWIAEQVQRQFCIDSTTDEILEQRERIVLDKVEEGEITQMPYAAEVLEHFAKELPTTLATGAATQESLIKLSRSGLIKIIESYQIPIISRDMVARGKPAPDTYICAAKKLGIAPNECIAFEDTIAGIESAENAGVNCLAVPNNWTKHKMPERKVYANLRDAQQFVERNYVLQPRR